MGRSSFFFAVVIGTVAQAQNLVPNGSFEEYTVCPDYFSQWNRVVDWISPYTTSADYFNACAGGDICNVPLNQFGYQFAFEGNAYMGLATCDGGGSPMYREIIAAELTEPLQVGVPVCISFRTTCGGYGSTGGNSAALKGRGPGAQFFVQLPDDWSSYLYPNTAAVFMDTVLADTANWVLVSGTYVPDSTYRYIAVGNFFADSLSWVMPLPGGGGFPVAYAFVDDVHVSYDLEFCGEHIGFDDAETERVLVYPNPVASELNFVLPTSVGSTTVCIRDIAGRVIDKHKSAPTPRNRTLDVSYLPEGVYVLHVTDSANSFAPVRFVHIAH